MMPAESIETGIIYCRDNLVQLAQLSPECVDLIYLDPPFFSNRHYEVIWGDEAEVRSFEDRWQGGINVYVNWLRERVIEMYRTLRATGSLYLHCDWHASHYIKVMLDEIFGANRFRNEIIWKRTAAHSSSKKFGPLHDTILYYAKGDTCTWNQQHIPHSSAYLAYKYQHIDVDGRRYEVDNLTAADTRNGSSGKAWRGIDPTAKGYHWKFTIENLEKLDAQGRIYWPARGGMPRYKRYLDEMKGVALQDIWDDIAPLNSQAKERLGYPTQKPEALLERIIQASTNVDDVVLDPFAGCGTSLVAAQRLGRRWVGIDISPTAVALMKRRMHAVGAMHVKLVGMPVSVEALRNLKPLEFQNWVIQQLNGTHSPRKSGDMGIDGYSFFLHEPIQVKQMDHIGRNVVDNFETAVQRSGKQKGSIVGFSFTKGAYEEVARAKAALGLEIELVKISDVLRDVASLITPVGGRRIAVPLPPPRPAGTLPSALDLIQSDLGAVAGQADDRADVRPLTRRAEDAPAADVPKRSRVPRKRAASG